MRNNLKECSFFDINRRKELEENIKKSKESIKNLNTSIKELKENRKSEKEKYLSRCEELQKKDEECEEQIEEGECELKENKRILIEKMKKRKAACIAILFIIFTNGSNMLVTAQELKNTLAESFNSSIKSEANVPEIEKTVIEEVVPVNKEEQIETPPEMEDYLREHMDYNFIIEDEQLHNVLDDRIEDIIFLTEDSQNVMKYKQFLTGCREGKTIKILPINDDGKTDLDELLNEIAEVLERPFLEKIDNGKLINSET